MIMMNNRDLFATFLLLFLFFIVLSHFIFSKFSVEPSKFCAQEYVEASFSTQIKNFPWDSFSAASEANDSEKIAVFSSLLLHKLIPFLIKSPIAPVNTSCLPPPLQLPPGPICTHLEQPRKVGVLLQFGFDVDALEVHLQELDAVVDKFFLIESIETHSAYIGKKPLLWDLVKFQQRFAPFLHKVVHFVVDDAYLAGVDDEDMWARESLQEKLRWSKFLEWNNATNYFTESDILGFGDTDEVPHRDNIFHLKHCSMISDPIDIGIWFPFGDIHTIFWTDFPVHPALPFTLGDPSYWTLGTAKQYNGEYPKRMRGSSRGHLLGGMHLSRYAYPPLRFSKLLTASEADSSHIKQVTDAGIHLMDDDLHAAAEKLNYIPLKLARRTVALENLQGMDEAVAGVVVKLPWFYECNRERYPAFEGKWDSRLN